MPRLTRPSPTHALFIAALTAAAAAASSPHSARIGPYEALPDLDCAIRTLAYNFSSVITPWADAVNVFDALRLDADCNATRPASSPRRASTVPIAAGASTFYVSPSGSDSAAGTQAAPFASIPRALAAARAAASPPSTIVLREGTFFLSAPLEIDAGDSGLTIQAFPGEVPVVSGGVSLAGLGWSPVPRPSPSPPGPISGPTLGSILDVGDRGCVDSPGATNPGVCAPLGQFATVASCSAACVNSSACTGYTWHDQKCGAWSTWCYARLDGQHAIDGAADHYSGWKEDVPPSNINVWVATLPAGVTMFDQLFFRGRRLTRARWPNANPEIQISPIGFSSGGVWAAPTQYPPATETHFPFLRNYSLHFPSFQWGVGGSCANFSTGSFWATKAPPAGAHYEVPSGITPPATSMPYGGPANWTQVRGAIVHGFQGEFWGSWSFNVSRLDPTGVLAFDAGGWQEARGGSGNTFYIENVAELLDETGEWFLDADTRLLSIAFNGTAADGNETLIAAQLYELVRVSGTSSAPVQNVSIVGVTFAHTLTDYLLPWTVPSGGDMSFHDGGMVRLSGTAGTTITGCTFSAPGGNGLMISGFNRATIVRENEFARTGSNAIMSAGLGGGVLDAAAPDFPEGTLIESNVGREIGMYVKQVGGVYMGVTANMTLRGNVFYNAARAGININDGFAGGHLLEKNLLFNTVRETHDHGGVNSWDREPYVWREGPTVAPLPMVITRNLIINNYNGVWSVCHDDGSNSYVDTFNFLPWSGTKNYLGFNKSSSGNWFIYSDYSPATASALSPNTAAPPPLANGWNACAMSYSGWAMGNLSDIYSNNTCITMNPAAIFAFNDVRVFPAPPPSKTQSHLRSRSLPSPPSQCNAADPNDGHVPIFSKNKYANPVNTYEFRCGKATWNLSEAQAMSVDVGSVLIPLPSTDDIIQAGHDLLQF